jgi:uncharacterized protein (TIGR03435 family)
VRLLPPLKEQAEVRTDMRAEGSPVIFAQTNSDSATIVANDGKSPSFAARLSFRDFMWGIYLIGAAALLLRLATGMIGAYRLRRHAYTESGRLTSPDCLSPITIGSLRTVTILPAGWREWPQGKLDAVLIHEHEHGRRHDPLFQWLALLNRAVFWFHPLAWWLERRLSALSEEACDVAVLQHGHDPGDYSEYLLDLARSVMQANGRLKVLGMAMPGHFLPERIKKILHGIYPQKISRLRMVCAVGVCAILSIPLAVGTLARPRLMTLVLPSAASPAVQPHPEKVEPEKAEEVVPAAPTPVAAAAPQTPAPPPATVVPKFEVASVKPCEIGGGQRGGPGSRGGGPGTPIVSPGRLNLVCQTVKQLIQQAYLTYAGAKQNNLLMNPTSVEGAADWINTQRYEIDATADPSTTREMMRGPMLQALLEDRFKLKVHRETREVPVYVMTVLKTGFKLQPLDPGSCDPRDMTKPGRPAIITPDMGFREVLQPGEKPSCGIAARTFGPGGATGQSQTVIGQAMGLAEFAGLLGGGMDRPVIDKTETTGIFNLKLVFARDQATAGFLPPPPPGIPAEPQPAIAADPAGPSIFTAIQEQLGLKLDPGRGPSQFLVVDHIERPSEN